MNGHETQVAAAARGDDDSLAALVGALASPGAMPRVDVDDT